MIKIILIPKLGLKAKYYFLLELRREFQLTIIIAE